MTDSPARQWRIEQYENLRFLTAEAEKLADSKNAAEFPVDWHFVERAIKNGLSQKQVLNLLT